MNQPLLSVIVPCYNVDKYVDKCISSIVGQTYPNLEILLIDDGSTDQTGVRCDVWQDKDKRIRVIHQQNEGLSYARKTGIENTTAEYVAFVDSDDWIVPNMFAKMMQALLSTHSDIAQCGYRKVFEDGRIEHCNTKNKTGSFEIFGKKEGVFMILDGRTWDSVMWNKIFKTQLFKHITFPKGRTYEDIPIMFRLFHHASQSVYLYDEYYSYFQRSTSITQDVNTAKKMKNRYDFYEAYHERTQFVEQHAEYQSILGYVRRFEMYAGMYALRDAVVYPQYFPDHYFETLSQRLNSYPFSLKTKRLNSSSSPTSAVVPYFIMTELLLLRMNPRWYKRFRQFYSKHPRLEKFLYRFDGFSIKKYLRKLNLFKKMNILGIKKVDIFHCLAFTYSKKLPMNANRYLLIAPHPDDEVFGCAGLLQRLIRLGKKVQVVILTQGEAVHENPLTGIPDIIAKRRELALNSAQILGLSPEQYTFLDWGDGKLHEIKNNETRQNELISIIETLKPEVIFTPHILDKSQDHVHATEFVRHCAPSIKLMYYCVWIWNTSPFQFDWKKSYTLSMTKKEKAAKSEAIDTYVLPTDEHGIPYSGDLHELPAWSRWRKELFFNN